MFVYALLRYCGQIKNKNPYFNEALPFYGSLEETKLIYFLNLKSKIAAVIFLFFIFFSKVNGMVMVMQIEKANYFKSHGISSRGLTVLDSFFIGVN